LLYIRLLNAVFLYLSQVIFYSLMRQLINPRTALIASLLFGLYWLTYKGLPVIMTESFVFFLITALCRAAWSYFKTSEAINRRWLLLVVLLACLALTKFLFGYVLLAGILIAGVTWIIRRKTKYLRMLLVFAGALLLTLPYLWYTF